jgi:hypothetical protein
VLPLYLECIIFASTFIILLQNCMYQNLNSIYNVFVNFRFTTKILTCHSTMGHFLPAHLAEHHCTIKDQSSGDHLHFENYIFHDSGLLNFEKFISANSAEDPCSSSDNFVASSSMD